MTDNLRYKTVAELVQAYKYGHVTAPLVLDNDDTHVCEPLPGAPGGHDDVFSMHPDQVLEQALDLLGVPHEHV